VTLSGEQVQQTADQEAAIDTTNRDLGDSTKSDDT
jgi:hypothetical protein